TRKPVSVWVSSVVGDPRLLKPHHARRSVTMANRKVLTIGLILGTALWTSPAFAQSAGSGGGSFANAFLIPTIVCNAGVFDVPANSLTCSKNGGGPKVLYGNIKTPSAANKNVLVMATLESSILTNTLVASKNGANSQSMASGAVVVKPHVMY